jgi:hypothetical protein
MKEDDAVIFTQGSLVPDIGRYTPPEVAKSGWGGIRSNPIHAIDSYAYGIMVSEVFNGGFSGSDQIGGTKNVPQAMQASFKRLTHAVPKMRLSVGHFLDQGRRSGGFFDTPLIQLTDGIDNLGLKSGDEREAFLKCVYQTVRRLALLMNRQRARSCRRFERLSGGLLQSQSSTRTSEVCRVRRRRCETFVTCHAIRVQAERRRI